MVFASQLRMGMSIVFENQTYRVIAADYHPGQGQMRGATHSRLQNIETGTFREHSFRADLRLQDLAVEKQVWEFLYADGDQCYFMNPANYEQMGIPQAVVGPHTSFLESGMQLPIEFVQGRPVQALFPAIVEVRIAATAPASHQQADSAFKNAKLANGVEVLVPQFIKTGDLIRLDLESMRYMDRARPEAKAKTT